MHITAQEMLAYFSPLVELCNVECLVYCRIYRGVSISKLVGGHEELLELLRTTVATLYLVNLLPLRVCSPDTLATLLVTTSTLTSAALYDKIT